VKFIQELFSKWTGTVQFPADSIVMSEAGSADVLFVVLSGELELSLRGEVLGQVSAGGIIGEMAMIGAVAGNPTVRAITDVSLARLDRDQFNRLIAANPEFSHHALAALANRLRTVNNFISAKLGK
jgi:CRP/FNR family transcriptional regulator, cyclic AMP receptor protein